MKRFFLSRKKVHVFDQQAVDEIKELSKLYHEGKYALILKRNSGELRPQNIAYDSYKTMFNLLAASNLKDKVQSVLLFERLLFKGGLRLFEKEERIYLEKFAETVLKNNFGDDLIGFPQPIRKLKLKFPRPELVDDDVKTLFILQ